MFINFFYHLRAHGVPVTPTELFTLLDALAYGLVGESLERFYTLGRAILIKRVEHYDLWDVAFAEFFRDQAFGVHITDAITDELLSWLNDPKAMRALTQDERAALKALNLDELRRQFEKRLLEQTERHDGGSHWIGTGGTSPFGHGGTNPAGVRVGGEGKSRSAVQVATARRFKNLRSDLRLDVRQISAALRKLRVLTRRGVANELDLDGTVEATAKNAGDLELHWQAPRKNRVKLLLLMDVGGSMTPYTRLCSELFSAAHQASHFQSFESYYFHNCPYEVVYKDMSRRKGVPFGEVLNNLNAQWKCIIVGDAAMAPGELMYVGGAIDLYQLNVRTGISWLREIKEVMPSSVWLNPDPVRYWNTSFTARKIQEIFSMKALTLEGLDEAVQELRRHAV